MATITPSKVPTAHGAGRNLLSFRIASRSSYPRPALCQRNPPSIQTPATYSPYRGNDEVLGSHHGHHTPGQPCAKGILHQFKPLPPTAHAVTVQGHGEYQWPRSQKARCRRHMDPAGTCGVLGSHHGHHTPGQPCAKGILHQFKPLPPTAHAVTV